MTTSDRSPDTPHTDAAAADTAAAAERSATAARPATGSAGARAVAERDPIAYLRGRGFGALADRMGIEPVEFTAERAVARMPVAGNTQPMLLLHGGAYVVLGETLGSMHANFLVPEGHVAVGVDINATHTGSATEGTVTGTCVPLHIGRSMFVHEIVITRDSDGKRCSTVRITNFVKRAH